MSHRFTIPRKMGFSRKPYRGVTLRQLIYLAIGAAAGGLILLNDFGGLDLVGRALIALPIFGLCAALAYIPIQGGHLDSFLPHVFRYWLRPRLRVWRKTGPGFAGLGGPVDLIDAPLAPPPVVLPRESILDRPLLPYGILVDLLVIVTLTLVTIFLVQGGYQLLVAYLTRR